MFETGADRDTARLEDYLRAARDRWYVLVLTIVACVLLAASFDSRGADSFTAEARVAVGPTPVGSPNQNTLQKPNLDREREVVASNAIADQVIEDLGLEISHRDLLQNLDVSFRPDSEVFRVAYTSTDPKNAADVANAVATTYVEDREEASLGYYQQQTDDLDASLALTIEQQTAIEERIGEIAERQARIKSAANLADQVESQQLASELDVLRTSLNGLLAAQRQIESDLRAAQRDLNSRPPSAELLGDAGVPETPDGLSRSIILAAGTFVGLMAGLAAAFMSQRLDTTARTDEQVQLALGSRVLGSLPRFGLRRFHGPNSLIMLSASRANRLEMARESFRRLATSVSYLAKSEEASAILITSSGPGEGKSTVAANLCIALAQAGQRVLLISADMRRPSQEERFGLSMAPGLADYLGGHESAEAQEVESVPNLWIITAGNLPANPGELLGSETFKLLIKEASVNIDLVIVDTPPVHSAADANAAARNVDGAIVVVDARRTDTEDLLRVRTDLERSGAKVLGSILNRKRLSASFLRRNPYRYYRARS